MSNRTAEIARRLVFFAGSIAIGSGFGELVFREQFWGAAVLAAGIIMAIPHGVSLRKAVRRAQRARQALDSMRGDLRKSPETVAMLSQLGDQELIAWLEAEAKKRAIEGKNQP